MAQPATYVDDFFAGKLEPDPLLVTCHRTCRDTAIRCGFEDDF